MSKVELQRVMAYHPGPEGKTASAIKNVVAKAMAKVRSFIPSFDFAPSFA